MRSAGEGARKQILFVLSIAFLGRKYAILLNRWIDKRERRTSPPHIWRVLAFPSLSLSLPFLSNSSNHQACIFKSKRLFGLSTQENDGQCPTEKNSEILASTLFPVWPPKWANHFSDSVLILEEKKIEACPNDERISRGHSIERGRKVRPRCEAKKRMKTRRKSEDEKMTCPKIFGMEEFLGIEGAPSGSKSNNHSPKRCKSVHTIFGYPKRPEWTGQKMLTLAREVRLRGWRCTKRRWKVLHSKKKQYEASHLVYYTCYLGISTPIVWPCTHLWGTFSFISFSKMSFLF